MKYFAPTLLPRNKWFKMRENVEIGDLVLELKVELELEVSVGDGADRRHLLWQGWIGQEGMY